MSPVGNQARDGRAKDGQRGEISRAGRLGRSGPTGCRQGFTAETRGGWGVLLAGVLFAQVRETVSTRPAQVRWKKT